MAPRRQQCAQSREDAKKTLPIVWHIVKTHNRELALALSLCRWRDALRLTAQSRALKSGWMALLTRFMISVQALWIMLLGDSNPLVDSVDTIYSSSDAASR